MNIPANAREFSRWLAEVRDTFPPDLQVKAERALLALEMMVGQEKQFAASEVLRHETAKDLMAFAEAYGAWKAGER